MTNWTELAQRYFASNNINPKDQLLNDGASLTNITLTTSSLGIKVPQEFVDLYSVHNGIGFVNPDMTWWLFRPLEHLAEFIPQTSDWFRKNHDELASRFFPFIDWGNGDGTGYLLNEHRKLLAGLYHFNTGAYDFDDDEQDSAEFLNLEYESIEQFFVGII